MVNTSTQNQHETSTQRKGKQTLNLDAKKMKKKSRNLDANHKNPLAGSGYEKEREPIQKTNIYKKLQAG